MPGLNVNGTTLEVSNAGPAIPSGRSFPFRWIRTTMLGWLLGFVLVVALAMVWDLVGDGAQWMVGVGMGAGVGILQGRMLRPWLGSAQPWMVASMVGMGAPFLAHDLAEAGGWDVPYSLPFYVVFGSLLTGVLQMRRLRAAVWVALSVLGWSTPALLMGAGDLIGGPMGGVLSMVGMLLGGILMGALTARPLERLLRRVQA